MAKASSFHATLVSSVAQAPGRNRRAGEAKDTPEIGFEVAQELIFRGRSLASVAEVVGLFEPLIEQVAGDGARPIGVDVDLLRKLSAGDRIRLSMKLVDKGHAGRILFGRGIGQILDQGVFAVVSFRILMPPPVVKVVETEAAEAQ